MYFPLNGVPIDRQSFSAESLGEEDSQHMNGEDSGLHETGYSNHFAWPRTEKLLSLRLASEARKARTFEGRADDDRKPAELSEDK